MRDWQPIETAPKDGSWLIGYAPEEQKPFYNPQTLAVFCFSNGGWMAVHNESQSIYGPPFFRLTHWMPLPEPPPVEIPGVQKQSFDRTDLR